MSNKFGSPVASWLEKAPANRGQYLGCDEPQIHRVFDDSMKVAKLFLGACDIILTL
jgi:hypothetical protein